MFRPGTGHHVKRFVNHFVTNCVDKKAAGVALLCILPICTERFTSQTGVEFWMSVVVSPCSSSGRSVSFSRNISCSGSTGSAEDCCASARQCQLRIYLPSLPGMVRLYFRPCSVDTVTLGRWHSICRYFSISWLNLIVFFLHKTLVRNPRRETVT